MLKDGSWIVRSLGGRGSRGGCFEKKFVYCISSLMNEFYFVQFNKLFMAGKDLHEKPFDETTIAKLQIFEDYAQAWIPTFVMSGTNAICIFDFFAGTGYDKNAIEGSPIRILNKIKQQIKNISQKISNWI